GQGGMGQVFRGEDTRLRRTVAIKILAPGIQAEPQFRNRFHAEARAISGLSHPNICTLFDIGHCEGIEFLVMEYVEGETLSSRLGKGPLSLDEAMRFAVQILNALEHAHLRGIIHRDLKPANLMLTGAGSRWLVKVLDFGLAKALHSASRDGSDNEETETNLT